MHNQLTLKDIIRGQKAKYCRFVDTKSWIDFGDLISVNPKLRFFAPDGTLQYPTLPLTCLPLPGRPAGEPRAAVWDERS
jgi:hypothetical protein